MTCHECGTTLASPDAWWLLTSGQRQRMVLAHARNAGHHLPSRNDLKYLYGESAYAGGWRRGPGGIWHPTVRRSA